MKKSPILFATALLALFFASCTSGGDESPSKENLLATNNQIFYSTKKPYTGSGELYMGVSTINSSVKIGTVNNGKIILNLPDNIDSHFLEAIAPVPSGINLEPLDVEAWFYTSPFRLLDNSGKHIGNLLYTELAENTATRTNEAVTYWYASKDMRMYGVNNVAGQVAEYDINAKKGWNEVYIRQTGDASRDEPTEVYVTTDLSKTPNGLTWMLWEM